MENSMDRDEILPVRFQPYDQPNKFPLVSVWM
jgi:hypothetical protein